MTSSGVSELTIRSGYSRRQYWRDLWCYRELFYFLAWRDILVRYKQTAIGIAWALLRPFLTMVVLTVVFGKIAKLPSDGGAPYPILVFAGMLPWQFFAARRFFIQLFSSTVFSLICINITYYLFKVFNHLADCCCNCISWKVYFK